MRYTEYHCGVAVIKDKNLSKEAIAKLARYEDQEEIVQKVNETPETAEKVQLHFDDDWGQRFMRTFLGSRA